MFDKKRAGPVRKHNGEKEYPAFDFWAPISRHLRIMAWEAGRVRKIAWRRAKFAAPSRGDFAHPTKLVLRRMSNGENYAAQITALPPPCAGSPAAA
jgi:hypothetical protein